MILFYILSLCFITLTSVNGSGKFINFKSVGPKEVKDIKTENQSRLIEDWSRNQRVRANPYEEDKIPKHKFLLGSKDVVQYESDIGFLATLLYAYNNHMVVRTTPEDWWITITQKIAVAIDKKAKDPLVRQFFVQHEGQKTLEVQINNINEIDSQNFFDKMNSQISKNINSPNYTTIMDCSFSTSTSIHKIVNNIMLMYSFKEYFKYSAGILCGLPGVIMEGTENDWIRLKTKLRDLQVHLQPLESVLGLQDWFIGSEDVLERLIDTYQGNPDLEWWKRIMTPVSSKNGGCGSPGTDSIGGWFVQDFLGLKQTIPWYHGIRRNTEERVCGNYWCNTQPGSSRQCLATDLEDIPSGLNTVPLTIKDYTTGHEEQTDLVAGVTGFKVERNAQSVQGYGNYHVAQTVHGWGLLVKPDSRYLPKTASELTQKKAEEVYSDDFDPVFDTSNNNERAGVFRPLNNGWVDTLGGQPT